MTTIENRETPEATGVQFRVTVHENNAWTYFVRESMGLGLKHIARAEVSVTGWSWELLGEFEAQVEASDGPAPEGADAVVLRHSMRHMTVVYVHDGWARIRSASDSLGEAQATCDRVTNLIRSENDEGESRIAFWALDPEKRPKVYDRLLATPRWDAVAANYSPDTQAAFEQLLELKDCPPERMILWHGPPGAGKTHALRALAWEWRDWCDVSFITDPERFVGGSPTYVFEVANHDLGRTPEERARRSKLIVCEDAGELITPEARHVTGQGLSRLLNMTDGMLGQGFKMMVLITTNEPISNLHPAVVRPGRCLQETEFGPLDTEHANQWLRERGSENRVTQPTILAELYTKLAPYSLQRSGPLAARRTGHLRVSPIAPLMPPGVVAEPADVPQSVARSDRLENGVSRGGSRTAPWLRMSEDHKTPVVNMIQYDVAALDNKTTALFLRESMALGLKHVARDQVPARSPWSRAMLGDLQELIHTSDGPEPLGLDAVLLRHGPRHITLALIHNGWATIRSASDDRALSQATCQEVVALVGAESDKTETQIAFWALRPDKWPKVYQRTLATSSWNEVNANYNRDTQAAFERLLELSDCPNERLILWHGPPGTGKTHALRALARAWRDWCDVSFITDPEQFVGGSPTYLFEVANYLHGGFGKRRSERSKLIICEDAGELMTTEARTAIGQGLSRLLNMTDGLLGQGFKMMVLITTNEPISNLHPAVVRPGRCLQETEFGPLDTEHANEWLRKRGADTTVDRPTTLAELYTNLAHPTPNDSNVPSSSAPTGTAK